MKRKGLYLITDNTLFELPVYVADSLAEAAEWLVVTPQRASNALYYHEAVKDKYYIYYVR